MQGQLLIASPSLRDPNFARTVVLICSHDAGGSMGVVLNRPGRHKISEALADIPGTSEREDTLQLGGPVHSDNVFILHDRPLLGGETLTPELAYGHDVDLLKRLLGEESTPAVRLRLYAGCAGWGAGQLEWELSQESWILAPVNQQAIFEANGEASWRDLLRGLGGRYALMALVPRDPELN
jgi:putative transcriptional regulator